MTLEELLTRRVAVWGLGQEGMGVVGLLRDRGAEPVLIDDDPAGAAARAVAAIGDRAVVAPASVDWSAVEVIVRSPGVSRYRPELIGAERAGAAITTAMAVWLADVADAPVLAVTGTKGKSTTATLAAAMLSAMGRRTELVGNIGVPVTDTYGRPRADAYVVEVSSYQAVDVTIAPRVCVLTSLAPDHLDWHGGEEAYYRDKLRLLAAGPAGRAAELAVNAGSEEALRRTAGDPDRLLYGPSGRVAVDREGGVSADGARLAEPGTLRVPGRHNLWNLCGAISGALLIEGRMPSAAAVAEAVAGFAGLPSRCQILGERDGRTFVDDALASNPFATSASVDVFAGRDLVLIAGGADRGVDARQLAVSLAARRPHPTVVVVGPGGHRVAEALSAVPGGERVPVRVAGSLEEAVSEAVAATGPGGVVLFSPAQPTPAEEGDFRARSRRFATSAGLPLPAAVTGGRSE